MKKVLAMIVLLPLVVSASPLVAQEPEYYSCSQTANPVTIPAMPLTKALEIYTQITRCPVSIDLRPAVASKQRKARTHAVHGELTPAAALKQMLVGTGIKSRQIKGGYSVY